MPDTLCEPCAAITLDVSSDIYEEEIRTYSNLEELRGNAASCKLCGMFYRAARQLQDPGIGEYCKQSWGLDFYNVLLVQSAISVQHRRAGTDHNLHIRCLLDAQNNPRYPGGPIAFDFRETLGGIFVDLDSYAAELISGRSYTKRKPKHEIIQLAKAKLAECCTNHDDCSIPGASRTFVPTRLLDLRDLNSRDGAVRLILNPQPSIGDYATLSYCWGGDMNLLLTSHSLRVFVDTGIASSSLPTTVRDACELCFGIGIRYLWVDSLCILQDSESDWMEQSSLMGLLFNNSTLTISAAKSKSCNTGIFVNEPDEPRESARLKCRTGDDHISGCWIHEMDQEFGGIREPTEYRAWIQQETLVSRRIFTLGTCQLSWQCATSCWNESGRMLEPSPSMKGVFPCPTLHNSLKLYDGDMVRQSDNDPLKEVWHELVSDYARRNLTMAKDKLPAISAVAKWLCARDAPTDEYLAGLWLSRLPADLMWFNELYFPATTSQVIKPSSYRAPSWSWASLDCKRLKWYNIGCEAVEAKVISHKLQYRGDDPFAEVQGGYLDIDALVRMAWLVPQTTYPEAYELWDNDWQSALCGTTTASTGIASGRVYLDMYDEDDLLRVKQVERAYRVQECECIRISALTGLIVEKIVRPGCNKDDREVFARRRIGIFVLKCQNPQSWWTRGSKRITRLL